MITLCADDSIFIHFCQVLGIFRISSEQEVFLLMRFFFALNNLYLNT